MLSIIKQYHRKKTIQIEKEGRQEEIGSWLPLSQKLFRKLVSITLRYDKYSDFIATNIWSYMGSNAQLLFHGDGVAIMMIDDYTNEPYYTLISKRSTNTLIKAIIDHDSSKKHNLIIRHVPRETVKHLKKNQHIINIEKDRDNHDYIYSVDKLINLNGLKLRSRKKQLAKVKKKYKGYKVIHTLQTNQKMIKEVIDLYKLWIEQTNQQNWQKDFEALTRILNQKTVPQIIVGLYINDRLAGFTVNEIIGDRYYLGFSGKANRNYANISLLIEHETAKIMRESYACKYLNLQQDLGIEGLRNYKLSLSPDRFIEKYKVTIAKRLNKF